MGKVCMLETDMWRRVCGSVQCRCTFTQGLGYMYLGICICDIFYIMNTAQDIHVHKCVMIYYIDK